MFLHNGGVFNRRGNQCVALLVPAAPAYHRNLPVIHREGRAAPLDCGGRLRGPPLSVDNSTPMESGDGTLLNRVVGRAESVAVLPPSACSPTYIKVTGVLTPLKRWVLAMLASEGGRCAWLRSRDPSGPRA